MIWWVFAGCSATTIIAIHGMFIDNVIWQSISSSIVAAYIFYLFMEFFPSLIRRHREYSMMAICYRNLQLMLNRLDSLFIEPYKTYMKHKIGNEETKISITAINVFFQIDFLKMFLIGFDLLQDSNCVYRDNSQKHLKFEEYLLSNWRDCKFYAQEAINMPYVQSNPKLYYDLKFLLSDSSIFLYFEKLINWKEFNFDYGNILCLNQPEIAERSLNNILELHHIAFKMYKKLKIKKRFPYVSKPEFYSEGNDKTLKK